VIHVVEISSWMSMFLKTLNETFKDRVWFVGLQGSYGRGEATETSDIDMVVILDELSASDIEAYGLMLDQCPNRELLCGFLSGKEELMHWDPADLFQFYYDTMPLLGSLGALLPLIDDAAVKRSIKIAAGNIYHGCVHNMLYDHSEDILKGLYKAASFAVQAIVFVQLGHYIRNRQELLALAGADEKKILETFFYLKNGGTVDFQPMSQALFDWAKLWINR
jgi:hypothetical protein